jgi:hypothetical protein
MKLISNRQLYGTNMIPNDVGPNEIFECPDHEVAKQLLSDGMARLPGPPKVFYEVKVIRPREVGPDIPFRDMPMSNEKPVGLVVKSDPVLSTPDISKSGTFNLSRRPGRFTGNKRR